MVRPKKDTETVHHRRIPIMMTDAEVAAIDDWRAEKRVWSRGEAIRMLVSKALGSEDNTVKGAADGNDDQLHNDPD